MFLLSWLLFLFFSRLHNFFLSSCLLCRSEMNRVKSVIWLLSCCITSIFSWSSILEEMLFIFIFNSSICFLLSANDGGPSCPHKLTSPRFSPGRPSVLCFPSTARWCYFSLLTVCKVSFITPGFILEGSDSEDLERIDVLGIAKLNFPKLGAYIPHLDSPWMTCPWWRLPERNWIPFPFTIW